MEYCSSLHEDLRHEQRRLIAMIKGPDETTGILCGDYKIAGCNYIRGSAAIIYRIDSWNMR